MAARSTKRNQVLWIKYDQFRKEKLHFGQPEPKTVKAANGLMSYHNIPILYDYDTPNGSVAAELLMEHPEFISRKGIKVFSGGGSTINFSFPLSRSENKEIKKIYDYIREESSKVVIGYYKERKMSYNRIKEYAKYKEDDPLRTNVIGELIWFPDDQEILEEDNRKGSIRVKVLKTGSNSAHFYSPDYEKIPFDHLVDVEASMVSVISFPRIYCGAAYVTIQTFLRSAVLSSYKEVGSLDIQGETAQSIRETSPETSTLFREDYQRTRGEKESASKFSPLIPENNEDMVGGIPSTIQGSPLRSPTKPASPPRGGRINKISDDQEGDQ